MHNVPRAIRIALTLPATEEIDNTLDVVENNIYTYCTCIYAISYLPISREITLPLFVKIMNNLPYFTMLYATIIILT